MEVLKKLGFDLKWVNSIMGWVKSLKYSIMLSGRRVVEVMGSFVPLSIILTMNVLSNMITKHVEWGRLKGIKMTSKCPILSHCLFADNDLFFMKATRSNCLMLKKIFKVYGKASGQLIKF